MIFKKSCQGKYVAKKIIFFQKIPCTNMKKWYYLNMIKDKKILGYHKTTKEPIFIYDFEWACNWYWSGGYIGNSKSHYHFDGCFLNAPDRRGHPLGNFAFSNNAAIWESLEFFLDDPAFSESQWWRIKDLFKQFYALRNAAEIFRCGGHCTPMGRREEELNPEMEKKINDHIENVIIRELRDILFAKKEIEKK